MTTAIKHPSIAPSAQTRRSRRCRRARLQPATTRARRLRGPPPPARLWLFLSPLPMRTGHRAPPRGDPGKGTPGPTPPTATAPPPRREAPGTRTRRSGPGRAAEAAPGGASPVPREGRRGVPGGCTPLPTRAGPPSSSLLLPPPRGGPGPSPRPGGAEGRQWAR